jgi:hypothetical protein
METANQKARIPFANAVLCLGLPGSASTWLFNVCISLAHAKGSLVHVLYTDRISDLSNGLERGAIGKDDMLVVKSHSAESGFVEALDCPPKYVLSVRDPRDCVVSFMERFGHSFDCSLDLVAQSCKSLLRAQSAGALLFRYESGFFDSLQTIARLQDYLGIERPVDIGSIMNACSKESIKDFIGRFDSLPDDRIVRKGDDEFDRMTHWHRNHFGDGETGKWRYRLDSCQQARANAVLANAIERFGYEKTARAYNSFLMRIPAMLLAFF